MNEKNLFTPTSHFVDSHGLTLHVVEWGQGPKALICHHGFLDHARTWDKMALALADEYRLIAVDARGHGDSDWVGQGGYYHFQEYVRDLDAVIRALVPEPFMMMGHSMGGRVASIYTGTYPESCLGLVLIEGSGPQTTEGETYPQLMRSWIETTRHVRKKERKTLPSLEAAAERLKKSNPKLEHTLALDLATHGTEKTTAGYRWKFDPLHMSKSPLPVTLDIVKYFNMNFDKPVLIFRGLDSEAHCDTPDIGEWPGQTRLIDVKNAGHMIQHDNVSEVLTHLRPFLASTFKKAQGDP